MGKKNRDDDFIDQMKTYRGVIPWSAAEHDWIIKTFNERRPKGIEGLPFPEEYPELKQDIKTSEGEELEKIKDLILFMDIFRRRYPKKLEYEAHSYRFNQINKFLERYYGELVQMRFVIEREDGLIVVPQLVETLCMSLYDEEDFDESGEWIGNTFSFKDVIEETRAKINKKARKNQPTEDKAFRGMIPWSRAEFTWVMDQHAKRMNHKEVQEMKDEYLSLKLQMMRQTGKKIDHFDTLVILNEIFHGRYPNPVEAMAHFFRYRSIFMFVDEYKDGLMKEGLVDLAGGEAALEPELIDSLCILPYSRETEGNSNKTHGFVYAEVVAKAKALRSARLN